MVKQYIIETKRLLLRPPTKDDFEGWCTMTMDEEVMTYIGGVQTRAESWRSFCSFIGGWELLGYGMFSVIEKSSGNWIGRIGPIHPLEWPGDEVGWGIVKAAYFKGYATEAAAATMDWAYENLGWDNIIHTITPKNIASIKVAQRLGSYNQGPTQLPPPFTSMEIDAWGQTRAEWQENRKKFL